jgi:hypothetical protein
MGAPLQTEVNLILGHIGAYLFEGQKELGL